MEKGGQSIIEGRHSSINSHLNQKVKLQDSDYWQEYSYEVESSINNEKYEDIKSELYELNKVYGSICVTSSPSVMVMSEGS